MATETSVADDLYALLVYLHADSNRDLIDAIRREELTFRQIKLLGILRSRRIRPTLRQVERLLDLKDGSASRLVDSLARRGLLRREPDDDDLRRKRLVITDRGDEAIARLHAARYDRVTEFVDELDAGQRAQLEQLLHPIADREDIAIFRPQPAVVVA